MRTHEFNCYVDRQYLHQPSNIFYTYVLTNKFQFYKELRPNIRLFSTSANLFTKLLLNSLLALSMPLRISSLAFGYLSVYSKKMLMVAYTVFGLIGYTQKVKERISVIPFQAHQMLFRIPLFLHLFLSHK